MSRYPSYDVARFDQQFAETESERNARLRTKQFAAEYERLAYPPSAARLSALHNLIKGAMLAVDNNDRVTAKAVLTNAEQMVLAMMEQGK